MTNLERVSQYCDPYVKGIIDAHLKEDAELEACRAGHALHDKYDEKLEAELAELRDDRDRLKANLLALDTAAARRYDELQEAVRVLASEHDALDRNPAQHCTNLIRSLRQLIEETE